MAQTSGGPSRREALAAMAGAPVAAGIAARTGAARMDAANFRLTGTYLNAAYTHPLPRDAAAAMIAWAEQRRDPGTPPPPHPRRSKALFARLVNATPAEIAWVPSTSYGESFVIGALGLRGDARARIVTDILHFDGALSAYAEIARTGPTLTVLPMTAQGRIDMNALDAAVRPGTRLVAVSLVSMVNGFEHDLKTVCAIAHARGAMVYADAIQAAGAVPIDVRASGVDFLACSGFKWLMGDFGCGFLYVRADRLPLLRRPEYGYHQQRRFAYRTLTGPAPLFDSDLDDVTAAGRFEVGSISYAAEVAVGVSLANILATGVERIQHDRQPLIDQLRAGLAHRYPAMTPPDARGPIVTFRCADAQRRLAPRLAAAGIAIQLYDDRFRVSPSVYNMMDDIERLIEVLDR